jgi:hypothetical protein
MGTASADITRPANVMPLGESCSALGCSSVVNDSSDYATALRNWCRDDDSTGDTTTTRPTCGNQDTFSLSPRGGHTPYDADWDVLQVDAGWCYKVKFIIDLAPDKTKTYDRRGLPTIWVKAADNADAHVVGQSSTSCP